MPTANFSDALQERADCSSARHKAQGKKIKLRLAGKTEYSMALLL
jgi:hypothetical protein